MATFFHGAPEMQSESLQTLYLMNPGYVGYADTAAPANMVLLNPSMNSINPMSNQAHQHLVGIPLQPNTTTTPAAAAIPSPESNPRLHYNLWTPAPTNNSIDISFGARRNSTMPLAQQGLSLSLSPQQTVYRYAPEPDVPSPLPEITEEVRVSGGGTAATTSASVTSNCMPSLQNVLMGSKFLKVAQQLLDEVVSVGKGFVKEDIGMVKGGGSKSSMKAHRESDDNCEGETSTKRGGSDLTTAERQELQMKKAKLVTMLDEVEQRYRQYHHQVQVVVSSFEAVAGPGSAKTYTALALQTISKQFRCLRDAISGQIRATSKNLGEDECLAGPKSEGGSRLRFVDHHLRQQRALQQLGMMQHNAWRPQRGLPERSVSVLRAWLFEHFLHPYPKDSDKVMLAKQTGLTRSQVSNWFINARVRLWKPMVEEMYLEETKEQEQNNIGEDQKTSKSEGNENSATNQESNINSPTRTDQTESIKSSGPSISASLANQAVYNDNEAMMHRAKLKKARTDELAISGNGDHNQSGYSLIAAGTVNHMSGLDAYQVGDYTPRFSGNGVALTLGLPHCDSISLSGGAQQAYHLSSESINPSSEFCSLRNNNNSNQTVVHASNAYENMNMQSRKRFAAQLLPDFVA